MIVSYQNFFFSSISPKWALQNVKGKCFVQVTRKTHRIPCRRHSWLWSSGLCRWRGRFRSPRLTHPDDRHILWWLLPILQQLKWNKLTESRKQSTCKFANLFQFNLSIKTKHFWFRATQSAKKLLNIF